MSTKSSTHFRKPFRCRIKYSEAQRNLRLLKGTLGLKVVESCKVTKGQIESGRIAIGRILKRKKGGIQVFVNAKANRIVTGKPAEIRMGKGKGSMVENIHLAQRGSIIYELKIPESIKSRGMQALKYAQTKMPMRTCIIWRSRLPAKFITKDSGSSSILFNPKDFL